MEPPYGIAARVRGAEPAHVLDISPHGALLETALPLAHRKACPVTFVLATGVLSLRATVRRCRTAVDQERRGLVFHAGLEFVNLSRQQWEVLEDVLVEYCLIEVAGRYESVAIGKS